MCFIQSLKEPVHLINDSEESNHRVQIVESDYNSTIVQNVVVTSWNSNDRSSWCLYEYNQRIDGRCWNHYLILSSQDQWSWQQ